MEQQRIYNTAIYCRLSKDDDNVGDSSSILTQKSMLESYCREQGFLIHDFYVDDGYSGLNFNRPAFERMLNDIDKGLINLVITKDLSRLGRDYIQTGYYTEVYFAKKKVRYIAINDRFDSNRDDNDIAPFKNILNDMYARDLSRKIKSAKKQRALNGYFISAQAPYGYKVNPLNKNQLIVDDEAAAIVRKIFDMALQGLGCVKIKRALTAERILNPSAYKAKNGDTRFARYNKFQDAELQYDWCHNTVKSMLKDCVYVGDMENRKYEISNYKTKERVRVPKEDHIIVENTHEAIVSRKDFEQVNAMISARHSPSVYTHENTFLGILKCSECGHILSLAHKPLKDGSTRGYYRCMSHYRIPNECHKPHAIYLDDLYGVVLEKIRSTARLLQDDDKFIAMVNKRIKQDAPTKKLSEKQSKLEKRLQELSRLLRKLFEDNATGLISNENYGAMFKIYQDEQAETAEKLKAVIAESAQKEDYRVSAEKLREIILEYLNIEKLTPFILNKLIERIEIGHLEMVGGQRQQEITIVWRFAGVVG